MTKKCIGLALAFVLTVLFACSCSESEKSQTLDPIKEKAREHYLAGRRLFLSNNPLNFPQAAAEFQRALEFWQDYPEANAALAETLSMAKGFRITDEEFGLAYTYAQRAIRLDPELSMGYRAMADLFRHKHENQKALQQINKAIQLDPGSAENYYVKGSILLAGDPESAKQNLEKALKLNPHLVKAYFNIAVANQQLGDLDAAEKAIAIYQEKVPQDIGGYCSQGIIYRKKGQPDKALQQFEQVITKDVKTDKNLWALQDHWIHLAYLVMGEIYLHEKQNPQKAVTYLEKALEMAPGSMETLNELVLAHNELGNKQKAEEYTKKIAEFQEMLKKQEPEQESIIEKGIPKEHRLPQAAPQSPEASEEENIE